MDFHPRNPVPSLRRALGSPGVPGAPVDEQARGPALAPGCALEDLRQARSGSVLATPTILLNLLLSFLLNAFSAFFLALSLVLLLQERAYARRKGGWPRCSSPPEPRPGPPGRRS